MEVVRSVTLSRSLARPSLAVQHSPLAAAGRGRLSSVVPLGLHRRLVKVVFCCFPFFVPLPSSPSFSSLWSPFCLLLFLSECLLDVLCISCQSLFSLPLSFLFLTFINFVVPALPPRLFFVCCPPHFFFFLFFGWSLAYFCSSFFVPLLLLHLLTLCFFVAYLFIHFFFHFSHLCFSRLCPVPFLSPS